MAATYGRLTGRVGVCLSTLGPGATNFVTAAVESDDERIKGSCMVILEEDDPGLFDRGVPTQKLVHQLSSTRDPAFNLKILHHVPPYEGVPQTRERGL